MQRYGRLVLLVAVLAVTVWLLPLGWLSPAAWAQEGLNRAALVVRFADGNVQTWCVSFDAPALSGPELLTRAGMQPILDYNSGMGGAVCSINGEGCAFPSQDCFCRCQGSECKYWAYYHGRDSRWLYSEVGAGNYQVKDGAVEGWSWGKGNFSSGTEPPPLRFDDVCSPLAAGAAVTGGTAAGSALTTAEQTPERPAAQRAAAQPISPAPSDTASLSRYGSFLLFAVALAGVWVWVFSRRKRLAPLASHAERES